MSNELEPNVSQKSYEEMFHDSQGQNIGEDLTSIFIQWENPGQTVVGMFLYSETIVPKEEMGPVTRYSIKTDEGTCSAILGGATDKQLEGKLIPGDYISIVYGGKKSIDGGKKQVNHFDVRRWGHDASYDNKGKPRNSK